MNSIYKILSSPLKSTNFPWIDTDVVQKHQNNQHRGSRPPSCRNSFSTSSISERLEFISKSNNSSGSDKYDAKILEKNIVNYNCRKITSQVFEHDKTTHREQQSVLKSEETGRESNQHQENHQKPAAVAVKSKSTIEMIAFPDQNQYIPQQFPIVTNPNQCVPQPIYLGHNSVEYPSHQMPIGPNPMQYAPQTIPIEASLMPYAVHQPTTAGHGFQYPPAQQMFYGYSPFQYPDQKFPLAASSYHYPSQQIIIGTNPFQYPTQQVIVGSSPIQYLPQQIPNESMPNQGFMQVRRMNNRTKDESTMVNHSTDGQVQRKRSRLSLVDQKLKDNVNVKRGTMPTGFLPEQLDANYHIYYRPVTAAANVMSARTSGKFFPKGIEKSEKNNSQSEEAESAEKIRIEKELLKALLRCQASRSRTADMAVKQEGLVKQSDENLGTIRILNPSNVQKLGINCTRLQIEKELVKALLEASISRIKSPSQMVNGAQICLSMSGSGVQDVKASPSSISSISTNTLASSRTKVSEIAETFEKSGRNTSAPSVSNNVLKILKKDRNLERSPMSDISLVTGSNGNSPGLSRNEEPVLSHISSCSHILPSSQQNDGDIDLLQSKDQRRKVLEDMLRKMCKVERGTKSNKDQSNPRPTSRPAQLKSTSSDSKHIPHSGMQPLIDKTTQIPIWNDVSDIGVQVDLKQKTEMLETPTHTTLESHAVGDKTEDLPSDWQNTLENGVRTETSAGDRSHNEINKKAKSAPLDIGVKPESSIKDLLLMFEQHVPVSKVEKQEVIEQVHHHTDIKSEQKSTKLRKSKHVAALTQKYDTITIDKKEVMQAHSIDSGMKHNYKIQEVGKKCTVKREDHTNENSVKMAKTTNTQIKLNDIKVAEGTPTQVKFNDVKIAEGTPTQVKFNDVKIAEGTPTQVKFNDIKIADGVASLTRKYDTIINTGTENIPIQCKDDFKRSSLTKTEPMTKDMKRLTVMQCNVDVQTTTSVALLSKKFDSINIAELEDAQVEDNSTVKPPKIKADETSKNDNKVAIRKQDQSKCHPAQNSNKVAMLARKFNNIEIFKIDRIQAQGLNVVQGAASESEDNSKVKTEQLNCLEAGKITSYALATEKDNEIKSVKNKEIQVIKDFQNNISEAEDQILEDCLKMSTTTQAKLDNVDMDTTQCDLNTNAEIQMQENKKEDVTTCFQNDLQQNNGDTASINERMNLETHNVQVALTKPEISITSDCKEVGTSLKPNHEQNTDIKSHNNMKCQCQTTNKCEIETSTEYWSENTDKEVNLIPEKGDGIKPDLIDIKEPKEESSQNSEIQPSLFVKQAVDKIRTESDTKLQDLTVKHRSSFAQVMAQLTRKRQEGRRKSERRSTVKNTVVNEVSSDSIVSGNKSQNSRGSAVDPILSDKEITTIVSSDLNKRPSNSKCVTSVTNVCKGSNSKNGKLLTVSQVYSRQNTKADHEEDIYSKDVSQEIHQSSGDSNILCAAAETEL